MGVMLFLMLIILLVCIDGEMLMVMWCGIF